MAFFFSRDTKVFMKWAYDSNNTALYELPVLDGFSFSQSTNTSEVTLSEAANSSGYSKRGRAMFTDSFAPAEWSFSTYVRPTTSDTGAAAASNQHAGNAKAFAVEGPLWAAMSANTYDNAIAGSGDGKVFDSAKATYGPNVFDFQNSNQVALGVFDLFFVLGAAKDSTSGLYETGQDGVTVYKLANCSVGSASVDFDIEGIAQVAWSGQGQSIEEAASVNTGTSATNDSSSPKYNLFPILIFLAGSTKTSQSLCSVLSSLRRNTSIFAPVFSLLPINLAGKTFVLFNINKSPSSK